MFYPDIPSFITPEQGWAQFVYQPNGYSLLQSPAFSSGTHSETVPGEGGAGKLSGYPLEEIGL